MVHLDHRDARPIYTQIVDGYRDQIRAGVLEKGDRLPSVRELAAQLAINPNTIQRAYRELELQGWIETIPGKGCFVCGIPVVSDPYSTTLLDAFDQTVEALLRSGVSAQTLIERIKGGR